jgi:hypothetical protein
LLFPAAFAPDRAARPLTAAEGDARCYDHPANQAVSHCEECGRFVCQLCAVDFRGGTWCPPCLAAGRSSQQSTALEPSRTLYDSIALMTALLPMILWPFTLVTAPAAMFLAVRYWRKPTGLLRRSKWRMVVAFLVGLAQVVGWVWLFTYILSQPRTVVE